MTRQTLRRRLLPLTTVSFLLAAATMQAYGQQPAQQPPPDPNSVVYKVTSLSGRMEMTVNTSRRLVMDQKIVEAQVNDPSILKITPLSPNAVQVSAEKPGVTQVNLWGEDKQIYTIDVIVHADARELQLKLVTQFPNASLKVVPVGTSVLVSGYVDQPEHVGLIIKIAEQYYPSVINNMVVSGVQQVLLHVKVMEVSRTKLRELGVDFAQISSGNLNNMVRSGISGLIGGVDPDKGVLLVSDTDTFRFGVLDGGGFFLGMLEALRQDNLAKILSEPNIITVSGQPAYFTVGGEFPYIEGIDNNGRVQIGWIKYGTRVNFVPIVLGNGRIRLLVRPEISEPDYGLQVQGTPAKKERIVDTNVEMQAGQTLAIAGLVQTRIEAENRGLPWVSDVPYVGTLFRRVEESRNEVELLILVTPELVEGMDAQEVPPCGPGMLTDSPDDCELYFKGHLEVPNCCPAGPEAGTTLGGAGEVAPGDMAPGELVPGGTILPQREEILAPQPEDSGATGSRPIINSRGPVRAQPIARSQPAAGATTVSHNRYTSSSPQLRQGGSRSARRDAEPSFIGPIGYDIVE